MQRRYVDGLKYAEAQNRCDAVGGWFSSAAPGVCGPPFDRPFALLLNIAVGGLLPGKGPSQTTLFPQVMRVRNGSCTCVIFIATKLLIQGMPAV